MKKFIDKKKMDFKFRNVGDGHRLDEEKPRPKSHSATAAPTQRSGPSSSSAAAGQAALTRLEGGGGRAASGRDQRVVHSPQASSQLPRQLCEATSEDIGSETVDTVSSCSVNVKMVCPICNRSIPHSKFRHHMTSCLHEEYLKEPLSASVQMIHTLCKDVAKRTNCIETICKYLDNVIDHPGEEKYRKIRVGNKTFADRVLCVDGADLFLEAVGFQQKLLPHSDGEEQFYVLPLGDKNESESESESVGGEGDKELCVYRELLCGSEPLKPSLDREVTLFRSSPAVTHFDLSDDFFQLSPEEIRREQKLKSEDVELNQVLRTRAMRERDEIKSVAKNYRFTLLRIRLPDGLFLQAVFRPLEKLQAVREIVSSILTDGSLVFSLSAFGQLLKDDSETLALLGLVPSAVLHLSWVGASPHSKQPYMEPGLLERIKRL